MEIASRNVAILEITDKICYIVNRPTMVIFLRDHTKKEFFRFIVKDMHSHGVVMKKKIRDIVQGEIYCLYEEWGITDFVEESWLRILWSGVKIDLA